MVERLRAAIEKARTARADLEATAPATHLRSAQEKAVRDSAGAGAALWQALPEAVLDPAHLAKQRVVTQDKMNPTHAVFDVLRTRIFRACQERGWRRVGLSSATAACGKSLIACNLALSFARQRDLRTVLVDMDLRRPTVAGMLGLKPATRLQDFLEGSLPTTGHFLRLGQNLALGLNATRVAASGELMQSVRARVSLDAMIETLKADIVIFDLPPILASDDAIAFLDALDCVIIVASASLTTADHLRECERQIEGNAAYLGVVLNKVEEQSVDNYADAYAAYRYS